MKIFFDDILINEDYYTALSTNFALFNDTFYLGSTATNVYNISVAKEAVTKQPSIVKIKDNETLVATLVVDKIEESDFEYKYTLTDKMINLEFYYDASEIFTNGSATLLEIAQDICNKAGISLATMDFRGYNKKISWYDNTRTAREYIGFIAELNGGYAQIGKDGKLYFIKHNTNSVKTISIDDCADFKIGEKHKITRVVYELGTLKYEYGNETGNTIYLNSDNVFITEQSEVEEIYNELNGFTFYSFGTSNCPIDYEIMAGQIITFTDDITSYPTIVSYNLSYNGGWYGGYDLDIKTKKQEETKVIGNNEKIKNLSIKVDRESNKITQAIKEIDEQNQKISEVTQTVNELNSKIGDFADITTSKESTYAKVEFEKINQSEPIYIKIHPIGKNISYLYPRENLYPSDDLFMTVRTLRFTNTTTGEIIDYELPTDLLYYDASNYDEFILDYDALSCEVNKRVGYNADGTTYLLDSVKTIKYDFPRIELTDGDYKIELLGYSNAYLFVRLMTQNYYTTQFATKAEMNSEISQTAEEIELSTDKKLSNYSTTTEMNAAISVKANEINSTVSETYSTKTETATAKTEAINSANASTDNKLKNYSTTSQMNSAINQTASNITSTVSSQITTAKTEAINSANSSTDAKLKNYSTTTQMNSAIEQKADSITSSVAKTYTTKTENTNTLNSAKSYTDTQVTSAKTEIKQTTDSIQAQVNSNDTDISTLNQTAKEINTKVEGKVDGNKIISTINQSAEAVKINADKISLKREGNQLNRRQYNYYK